MPETKKETIQCPSCGLVMAINFSPAVLQKTLVCPNCHTSRKVAEYLLYREPTTKNNEGSTQVVRNVLPKQAQLTDLSTGRSYSLQRGKNTLGRKAATSDATVQIETTDSFMSRNHIGIDVENQNGGIYCVLYNTRNRNKTLVNGNRVEEGDRIELQNGTIITLGNTQLKFTLQ
jgi:pSer/pThr/pTyr-binding forkhead associated (FHA) protein